MNLFRILALFIVAWAVTSIVRRMLQRGRPERRRVRSRTDRPEPAEFEVLDDDGRP